MPSRAFVELLAIARHTRQRLVENLGLALLMPLIGLPLAVTGLVTPIVAAILMGLGTVLILGNSYRPIQYTESFETN